jgi:hypothetical protein
MPPVALVLMLVLLVRHGKEHPGAYPNVARVLASQV